MRMDNVPPIIFTPQVASASDGAALFSCRCIVYIVATSKSNAEVSPQLDNFFDEFIALVAEIEVVDTPALFSYT